MKTYHGNCHCGSIKFSFDSEEIDKGIRCNCSICKRKAALMTPFTISSANLHRQGDTLAYYQFGSHVAKHYFCNNCGIYVFHETRRTPGEFRVNLTCIDEINTFDLPFNVFDGASLQ
jgi:hypothetical protein